MVSPLAPGLSEIGRWEPARAPGAGIEMKFGMLKVTSVFSLQAVADGSYTVMVLGGLTPI